MSVDLACRSWPANDSRRCNIDDLLGSRLETPSLLQFGGYAVGRYVGSGYSTHAVHHRGANWKCS
jgi:hypothetical protein